MRKILLLWLLLLPLGAVAQARELPDFTELVEKQGPAVVNISTAQTVRERATLPQMPNLDEDDPFYEFFRRFMPQNPGQSPREFSTRSLGSGFIISADGYILTNAHVVDGADEITVRLTDKREFKAKVIGADKRTDVALIKIEATGLPMVKLGDPNKLKVGEWVLAIGSPFGFDNTVTAGIVSGKGRSLPQENLVPFIQTDAAVNPGNSGGPLFNMRGEVVGINTAIASESGGYEGIGFALPINTAAMVYNAIIKDGKVTRGGIGISFGQSDDPTTTANLKASGVNEGVFVLAVAPGGPSDKAGIRDGDVVVAINGKPVRDGNQLTGMVTSTPVGNSLDVTVVREGKRQNLKVQVADLAQIFPDRFGNGNEAAPEKQEGTTVSFGMTIETLAERQIETLGIKEKGGVRVIEVEPNSFAEDIRLQKGDVIIAIAGQHINNIEDVKKVQATLKPGDAVQFRVLRREAPNSTTWTNYYLAGFLPAKQ